MIMKQKYNSIGKNIPRRDAVEKVRGIPVFSADLEFENAISLKALRSGRPHAVIEKIDVTDALKIKGVIQVFTAEDIPGKNLLGLLNKDQELLASQKVRSIADPVALVAAENDDVAVRALKSIKVVYTDLPAVFDPEEALKPDAPKIHDKGNLLFTRKIKKGNTGKAFKKCSSVIEKTYRTNKLEHNYLEPDAGAGYIDVDGTIVIHASTQNPFYDHKEVVSLLGVENDRVRIIQAATGGGFGSKLDMNVQGFIGLALFYLKRPVRYVYTREEAYLATAKRHPLIMRIKTGTDGNGKLMAAELRIICNTGAYGSYGIAVASRSAVHGTGPYEVKNVDIECHCVYTNDLFCGAMRGFGTPQMAFAHESQLDLHAADLGIDPLEIRVINGFRTGSETATGQILADSVGFQECLEKIRPYYEEVKKNWVKQKTQPAIKRGVGVGGMWYGIGNTGTKNPAYAEIEMNAHGNVTVFTGCAEIGQGSSTVLPQIAAESLGIDPSSINVVVGDTRYTLDAGATSASRQTYISGNAVKDAAEKLTDLLLTLACSELKVPRDVLELENGEIYVSSNHEKRISFAELASQIYKQGGSLKCKGYFDPETIPLDPETGRGIPYATYAFACHMACVEVDALTGEVNVKKIVAAHDVGKAIHPENVIGQICGGVAMGMGFALMEEFETGKTESMKDYNIPTCADMPEVIPIIVESEEPTGPFGAKGVGEPALIPTAPAIVNAVTNAVKERIYTLPANLERVLEASIKSGCFGPEEGIKNV